MFQAHYKLLNTFFFKSTLYTLHEHCIVADCSIRVTYCVGVYIKVCLSCILQHGIKFTYFAIQHFNYSHAIMTHGLSQIYFLWPNHFLMIHAPITAYAQLFERHYFCGFGGCLVAHEIYIFEKNDCQDWLYAIQQTNRVKSTDLNYENPKNYQSAKIIYPENVYVYGKQGVFIIQHCQLVAHLTLSMFP